MDFVYVFFGGIIFGMLIGSLMIKLRTALMSRHVDIASIVISLNVITPLVTYWLAEKLQLSGILAVVAAGIMHSILYDRLHLTSAKVQIATTTIWAIISDALNGLVFVFLGLSLPMVLKRMRQLQTLKILVTALVLYLAMFVLRYCWSRFGLVKLKSTDINQDPRKDSAILAIGGIHGTITMAMSFSIPVLVNEQHDAMRGVLILMAAFVILISLLVGTFAFPKLLPQKKKSYTENEFQQALTATVQYAITELSSDSDSAREKALVIDQLSSQMTTHSHLNSEAYNQLLQKCRDVELDTLEELTDNDVITPRQRRPYSRLMARDIFNRSNHGFLNLISMTYHRIRWGHNRKKWMKKHQQIIQYFQDHPEKQEQRRKEFQNINEEVSTILRIVLRRVNKYLNDVQTTKNAAEVTAVRRTYLNRYRFFSRRNQTDADKMTSFFIDAFQSEHSYIQQQAAAGHFSSGLANALNEQVSTDQLVYMQSLD